MGGTRLNETFLETIIVRDRNLPDNIKTRIKDVAGKYVSETIYAGEYVRDEVLSNAFKPPINDSVKVQPAVPDDSGFIVVTDYIKASTGEDVAGALQKLIDKNWGKTLYFPDGEYLLSYPIQTSAVAGQTMSFILSPGAVIRAAKTWNGIKYANALFCMGALSDQANGATAVIRGGVFDGNGKADGIAVMAGTDSVIEDVCIVDTRIGIDMGQGVTGWKVKNVTVLGNGTMGNLGLKVFCNECEFIDVKLYNMHTALGIMGTGNLFYGVRVENTVDDSSYANASVGVSDNGSDNMYYDCTMVNCQIAYQTKNAQIFGKNEAIWTNDLCRSQVAIDVSGTLPLISSFRAEFYGDTTQKTIITSNSRNNKFDGIITNYPFVKNDKYTKMLLTPAIPIS